MSSDFIRPSQYQAELNVKLQAMEQLFAPLHLPEINLFPSAPTHYRMRAEFKIWHQGDECFYAMQPPGDKSAPPILMSEFPVASETINFAMPVLLQLLNQSPLLKRKLFQVEFLSSTTKELLITLIYHRPLTDEWQQQAVALQDNLQQRLAGNLAKLDIIGRSRKQRIILGRDFVNETLEVDGKAHYYQQVENSFTQPNAGVCQTMLQWAVDCAKQLTGDLLELYCGNGNFTIPLSYQFERVLATEISKTSVASALHNIAVNQRTNIDIARLSSEEFSQAYQGVRPFRRLANIDLPGFNFSTIFVDPPRAGLDEQTLALAGQFKNILYISCNPYTLQQNLIALQESHEIKAFALFDQFPYTDHMECGVWLKARE
ncbi:tRNA (uridine(54)-C5)-methyltransferase TrmA [Halioxenophilus sp. WMMB6]|uniref:tRNA (uridine(54)-C5)-methyltransferase TrmA n=1 Tax=Halioxenophilus sp. WMMB6 TaxID=3073815 RepID=UPI00295F403A|nr:tRNA (uridine(54)-C5)-methyltransferase TrmA [Halioxenophilus sp. WMMB6]